MDLNFYLDPKEKCTKEMLLKAYPRFYNNLEVQDARGASAAHFQDEDTEPSE